MLFLGVYQRPKILVTGREKDVRHAPCEAELQPLDGAGIALCQPLDGIADTVTGGVHLRVG